jgi:hypothetical protein
MACPGFKASTNIVTPNAIMTPLLMLLPLKPVMIR